MARLQTQDVVVDDRRRVIRFVGELWAVGLIFILAFLLRFGWVGVSAFAGDEANIGIYALNMLHNGQFVAVGKPSSVAIPFPPLSIWAFLPPFALTPDPLWANWYVSALSWFTVMGTWALARRVWGLWAGLAAALFMAVSPYAIFYGRSIWEPNLLAPIALAWAWSAYIAATTERPRLKMFMIGLHVFLGGAAFQVHFAALPLALGTGLIFLRFRWWRQIAPVLIGGMLSVLLLAPYVYTVACCRADIWERFVNLSGGSPAIDLNAAGNGANIALGIGWEGFAAGGDFSSNTLLNLGAAALSLLGIASLIVAWRKSAKHSRALIEIIAVWLIVSPIFFLRHTSPVLPHYQLMMLPALALVVAAGVLLARRFAPFVVIAMLVIAAFWLSADVQSLNSAQATQPQNTALSSSLGTARDAAYAVPTDRPLLYFGLGDRLFIDNDAAVFGVFFWQREHRILDAWRLLVLPPYPAYLMFTLPTIPGWEEAEAAGLTANAVALPRRDNEPPYMMFAYDGESDPLGYTWLDTPVLFDSGLQLEGWKVRAAIDNPNLMYVAMLYRVVSVPADGTIQQFTHLRDAAAVDPTTPSPYVSDVALSRDDWRVGDRLIAITSFTVEGAGEYWLDVGNYSLETLTRFARADGEGDLVRLGAFTWQP